MDEGRKRVLGIIAGILVAHYLKTTEDLFDTRDSTRTGSMAAAAVQWAERIMQKIDNVTADEKVKPKTHPREEIGGPGYGAGPSYFGAALAWITSPHQILITMPTVLGSYPALDHRPARSASATKGGRGRCHLPRGILSA